MHLQRVLLTCSLVVASPVSCSPETMQPAQAEACVEGPSDQDVPIREAVVRYFIARFTAAARKPPSVYFIGVDDGDSGNVEFFWDPPQSLLERLAHSRPKVQPYSVSIDATKNGRLSYSRTHDYAVLVVTRRICWLTDKSVQLDAERYFFPLIGAGYTVRLDFVDNLWVVHDFNETWIE